MIFLKQNEYQKVWVITLQSNLPKKTSYSTSIMQFIFFKFISSLYITIDNFYPFLLKWLKLFWVHLMLHYHFWLIVFKQKEIEQKRISSTQPSENYRDDIGEYGIYIEAYDLKLPLRILQTQWYMKIPLLFATQLYTARGVYLK